MKKTIVLIIGLLIAGMVTQAQSNEIGITLSQFYRNKSSETNMYSSMPNNQNNIYRRINPYLTFAHIKKNQTIYSLQYAYVPYKSQSNNSTGVEGSALYQKSHVVYTQNIHAIRIGVGKRTNWNQFSFSSMIYLPIEYSSRSYYKSESTRADSNNSISYSAITKTINPPSFLFGFFISQSINYSISKKLKLGAEFNLGIQESLTRGTSTYYNYSEDHGNVVNDLTYQGRKNITQTYYNFIPSLAISYSF